MGSLISNCRMPLWLGRATRMLEMRWLWVRRRERMDLLGSSSLILWRP